MKEVSVLGIAFDEANDMAAVILSREGARNVVPIPIDIQEGITVIRLLQKKKMPRPMTHDLMINIIGDLHHTVKKVEIDLGEAPGSYIASVEMGAGKERVDGMPIFLDATPFDAIAIAIKSDAPMFMSESAYDANSVPLVVEKKDDDDEDDDEEEGDGDEEEDFKQFVQGLKASDFNTLNRMIGESDDDEPVADSEPKPKPKPKRKSKGKKEPSAEDQFSDESSDKGSKESEDKGKKEDSDDES